MATLDEILTLDIELQGAAWLLNERNPAQGITQVKRLAAMNTTLDDRDDVIVNDDATMRQIARNVIQPNVDEADELEAANAAYARLDESQVELIRSTLGDGLVALLRAGHTLAESARQLNICRNVVWKRVTRVRKEFGILG